MSSSGHLPESGRHKCSRKRSRKSSDSGSNSSSKKSRKSINSRSNSENDIDDENSISRCSEKLEAVSKKSKNSFKGSACADLVTKALIPIFRHWILVVKFRGKTLWMEATKIGNNFQSRNLDSEPEGVVESSFIGKVYDVSVSKSLDLFEESKFIVEKYSLKGANFQRWIKSILNELGLGVMIEVGSVAKDFVKWSARASFSGSALALGCKVASDLSSGSKSVRMSKESGSSRSSKS